MNTNPEAMTRKDQVLLELQRNVNRWVNGPELANERVGGSEGLKRLRELRQDGHRIQQRRHPNPDRDIWQYRLVTEPPVSPLREAVKQGADGRWDYTPPEPEIIKNDPVADSLPMYQFTKKPTKVDFGAVAVCPRCHAKTRKHKYGDVTDLRHKDPYKEKQPCLGCGGWGIVPNKGPIPMTMPEGTK